MTREEKEALLTKEELDKVDEHRFYVRMSLRQRIRIRKNLKQLKKKHDLTMSEVFRKVMLEMIKDDEFITLLKD